MAAPESRRVTLREEHDDSGSRSLEAYLDEDSNLRLDAQDLGQGTELVSGDGEYEYFKTIAAEDLPSLLAVLEAPTAADILDVLAAHWTGAASYDLEDRIHRSGLRTNLWTWSG